VLKKMLAGVGVAFFGLSASAMAQTTDPTIDSIKTSATGAIEDGAYAVAALLVAVLGVVVVVSLARKAPKVVKGVIGRL